MLPRVVGGASQHVISHVIDDGVLTRKSCCCIGVAILMLKSSHPNHKGDVIARQCSAAHPTQIGKRLNCQLEGIASPTQQHDFRVRMPTSSTGTAAEESQVRRQDHKQEAVRHSSRGTAAEESQVRHKQEAVRHSSTGTAAEESQVRRQDHKQEAVRH